MDLAHLLVVAELSQGFRLKRMYNGQGVPLYFAIKIGKGVRKHRVRERRNSMQHYQVHTAGLKKRAVVIVLEEPSAISEPYARRNAFASGSLYPAGGGMMGSMLWIASFAPHQGLGLQKTGYTMPRSQWTPSP